MDKDYKYIDLTYIKEIAGGNDEVIKDMIDLFKIQVSEMMTEMKNCNAKNDWKGLRRIVHTLKTSSKVMGMHKVAENLQEFEIQVKEKRNANMYFEYINEFDKASRLALAELNEEIRKLGYNS